MQIDVDRLRDYMIDKYGTAVFSGQWPALGDLEDVANMDDYELCAYAEDAGVDLRKFEAS